MGNDNTIYPRFGRQQWHRRKRSVQGKNWAPPNIQTVHRGVWCPRCKVRHPYNGGKDKLVTQYVRRPGDVLFQVMWCCPVTLDVIGELEYKEPVADVADGQSEENDHGSSSDTDNQLPGDDGG